MKKIITILLPLILIAGAVVFVKKKVSENNAIPTPKSYAMSVKSFTPHEDNVTLSVPVLALVKNDHDLSLSSKFSANILFIASSGKDVKAGEALVRLDDRDLAAKQEALKSALFAAKNEEKAKAISLQYEKEFHQRTVELLAVKGASIEQSQGEESRIALLQSDMVNIKSKQVQIQSDIQTLNAQISYATLRSCVDGTIGETFAAVGDMAVPGKPLVSIRAKNGSYLWIRVALNTPAKKLIYENHQIALHFLQNNEGMDEYRGDLPLSLPSGARIEAKLVVYEGKGILLPREAVLLKENKAYVFVIDGQTTKAHEVTIVSQGDEGYVVKNVPNAKLAVAKPDILLKLAGGVAVTVKE